MRTLILFLLLLALTAVSASAAIYRVSPDGTGTHTTINAAIAATSANDTIVIRGELGTYNESVTLPRPLTLIGQGNGCYDVAGTIIFGSINLNSNDCSGSVIEGVLVIVPSNPNTIALNIGSGNTGVMVRRCLLSTMYLGCVVIGTGSAVTIENCTLLMSCGGGCPHGAVYVGASSLAHITNCIISGGTYGVRLDATTASAFVTNCVILDAVYATYGSGTWAVDNTVIWDCGSGTTISGNTMNSYNAFDPTVLTAWPGGTGNVSLSADPFVENDEGIPFQFCDAGTPTDLHPAPGSPLIDAGDPTLPGDLEGAGTATRDIGIYGGEQPMVDTGAPDFPFVTILLMNATVPQNGVLEVRATGRVGRGQ